MLITTELAFGKHTPGCFKLFFFFYFFLTIVFVQMSVRINWLKWLHL